MHIRFMAAHLMRHFLLAVLCTMACTAQAQIAAARALEAQLINKDLDPHERARKLERLSWYRCAADPMRAMEAAQEAMVLAEQVNDKSLLGSAIVRKIAAKQTAGDRGGDAAELNEAVALLSDNGPERDLGYAYWCLFMDLSEVAGQDSLRALHEQRARTIFERHHEAWGRYWGMLVDLFRGTLDAQASDSTDQAIVRLIAEAQDTSLRLNHQDWLLNKAFAAEDFIAADRLANEHLMMSRAVGSPFEEFISRSELMTLAAFLGDHEQAIRQGLMALDLAERHRLTTYGRWMHSEVGARFADLGDHASAMEHFRRALSLAGGPHQPWDRFQVLLNLARSCLKTGRYDTALVVLHDAERLFTAGASSTFTIYENSLRANLLLHLGTAYREKGDPKRSLAYLEQALAVADDPGLRLEATRIHVEHARTLALGSASDRKAAIMEADSVIALAGREHWLEAVRDARLALAEAHDKDGNAAAALRNLRLHILAKDSLIDLERIKNINALNKRFASERKDAELKTLASTNAQQGEEIMAHRQRNMLLIALVAVTALVGALLFVLLRNARRSKALLAEKNAAILVAQAKLVESERAREASEVRTRIARDVHDQLGSDLTKLVLLSTEVKEVASMEGSGISAIADNIERIAGEANRSLGDIVWAIDPHHDSLAGLTERVRLHCERMLKWSKVEHTIDCAHEGPDRNLDPATKRDIYLMLREALNNAIKYAKAKHIHVRFHSSATYVAFEVKDDGVGMGGDTTPGHGLSNMRARAARVGGSLSITGSGGNGTSLVFRLSLSTDPPA